MGKGFVNILWMEAIVLSWLCPSQQHILTQDFTYSGFSLFVLTESAYLANCFKDLTISINGQIYFYVAEFY